MHTSMRVVVVATLSVVASCSGSRPTPAPEPSPGSAVPQPPHGTDDPHFATPPPPIVPDAPPPPPPPPPPPAGNRSYMSDCSLTHPIARDTCRGAAVPTRGFQSCAALKVRPGQACGASAPSCYVEQTCPDGHQAIQDYLICATKEPSKCMTRSSRRYKQDIHYLSSAELVALARRIKTLPLASYRYKEQSGGDARLGFVTEDALDAPFVSDDGSTVDLYSLLAASIAAIQTQDARIQALEQALRSSQGNHCKAAP